MKNLSLAQRRDLMHSIQNICNALTVKVEDGALVDVQILMPDLLPSVELLLQVNFTAAEKEVLARMLSNLNKTLLTEYFNYPGLVTIIKQLEN